jgi:hypothetical protein
METDGSIHVPYSVFRFAAGITVPSNATAPEKCFSQNLKWLTEHVDDVLFVLEPWQLWERFGACFLALRVNAFQILGVTELYAADLLWRCGKIAGHDRIVALKPVEVHECRETVLNHFGIIISGAEWSSKPESAALSDICDDVYTWTEAAEDISEQRKAYMAHLEKNVLFLPSGYAVIDCAKNSNLLSVKGIGGKFKFNGTTDVVVARTEHVDASAVRHHVEVELELKTTRNNKMKNHEPQAVLEHLSSSFLNKTSGVLTVLTDLNEKWVFYWFHPNGKEIMKYGTDRKRAQFLLDNMIPNNSKTDCTAADLPKHFWKRGMWETVVNGLLDTIKEDDGADGPGSKKRKLDRNESSDARTNDSNQGGDSASSGSTHGGSGHDKDEDCKLAQLFDYVGHDVGNEMDLLSMTDDEDERIRVVRRFLARHIVPGIVGEGISEVGIDCRTPPSDETACPTLSESNVLRHNTASS